MLDYHSHTEMVLVMPTKRIKTVAKQLKALLKGKDQDDYKEIVDLQKAFAFAAKQKQGKEVHGAIYDHKQEVEKLLERDIGGEEEPHVVH